MDKSHHRPPFNRPDYTEFRPFYEVFGKLWEEWNESASRNSTLQALDHRMERMLEARLRDIGFMRVGAKTHRGSFAIVFEGSNHQMLRVVNKANAETRSTNWNVLQPIMKVDFNGEGLIEILPKVHTLKEIIEDANLRQQYGITQKIAAEMIRQLLINSLHDNDSVLFDASARNVGIVRDRSGQNVPVIIDPGVIIDSAKLGDPMHSKTSATFMEVLKRRLDSHFCTVEEDTDRALARSDAEIHRMLQYLRREPVKSWPFEEAQKCHMETLGLKYGETVNTIGIEKLRQFAKDHDHLSQLAPGYLPLMTTYEKMAERDGLYPSEISGIVRRASENARLKDRKLGFCQKIQKAADDYKDKLNSR